MTAHTSGSQTPSPAAGGQAPQAPWSVKGIAPHTREAVKDAARRSGMTVGEWLSCAIARQAEVDPAEVEPAEPEPAPARLSVSDERWAQVAAHLARLVRRDAEAPPSPQLPAQALQQVSASAIVQWLREAEARAVHRERMRAAHLAEALTGLARYIDNAERARAEEARRAALAHEEATRELAHTVARTLRQVKRIDERLARLPGETAAALAPPAGEAAAEQARQVAAHLLPVMEERLAAGLREIVESLTPAAGEPAAPGADQLAVEDRLARAIVDIRARQVELARIEAEDDENGPQAIIARLEALSRKLDTALRPAGDDRPAALARIEDMVRALSENVETLHHARGQETGLDSLAAQISQLVLQLEELARQGREDGGPDAGREADPESRARQQNLEAAIGALSLQLRDLPRADEATLELVARAAAREALGALSPDDALPRARSDDTLDAVHSTLERIVDRLALIEEDIRAGAQPQPEAAGDRTPPGALSMPEVRAAQALSRVFAPPATETDVPDTDGPENLLARDSGGLTENVGFTASFIAAARRAAMAAADETRQKPSDPTPPDAAGRRRSLLIGLGALIAATGAAQVAATLAQGAARMS